MFLAIVMVRAWASDAGLSMSTYALTCPSHETQDTYTDVRKAFASAPSAWVDLRRQVIETPRALRASFAHLQAQWRALVSFLRAPGAAMAAAAAEASGHIELSDIGGGNGLSPLQPPPPAALSLAAVITALCEPPLALQHAVSFRDLAALLAVSVEEVEAVCTSWHLLAVLESGRSGGRGGVAAAGRPARGPLVLLSGGARKRRRSGRGARAGSRWQRCSRSQT